MRKFQTVLFLFLLVAFSYAQNKRSVVGTVSNSNGPLNDVDIHILNKGVKTSSLDDGSYRIPIETGDVLAYNAQGMQPIQIKVEDVTRVLNVDLSPRTEKLKNVTVAQKKDKAGSKFRRRRSNSKDLIQTAFGPLDKSKVAYTVRTMDADNITQGEYNLLNVLRGRFPGLRFGNGFGLNTNNRQRGFATFSGLDNFGAVFMRNGSPVTFDIDGQLFTDFPGFIAVQNIEKIALIPSLAGTMRYGTFGRGGVIVINTKTGSGGLWGENGLYSNNTMLQNNNFEETVLSEQAVLKSAPIYLKELHGANSLGEAKSIFGRNSKKYASSPYHTLDSYQYFHDKWKAVGFADTIIENGYKLFEDNPVLLKALAYIYEEQERHDLAYETLKKVFILRPHYAQSYLDIANSNRNLNNEVRAATLYARYFHLLNKGMLQADTTGFSTLIKRDFDNLLSTSKTAISGKKSVKKNKIVDNDLEDTRLVFEWNDGEAEFDLQFVSPENQFYTWKHSITENAETIMKEKDLGYSCSEYLIDDSFSGTWKINVKYLGNKSLTPTYLKATIYHDYGTKTQHKEVRVFKLDVKNANRELFKITKTAS